jgi:23S rRNA-/tRNA-specific pseudouridylate synthase
MEKATPRVDEAPFDSGRKMMSTIHDLGGKFVQYTKGAPDEILKICTGALVEGEIKEQEGVFESFLQEDAKGYKVRSVAEGAPRSRFARTEWKTLSAGKGKTLVEVTLKSGRKNQIRVHFSESGHPVVGDCKYGAKRACRLFLHSLRLSFVHPRTGKMMEFFSPSDFSIDERVS